MLAGNRRVGQKIIWRGGELVYPDVSGPRESPGHELPAGGDIGGGRDSSPGNRCTAVGHQKRQDEYGPNNPHDLYFFHFSPLSPTEIDQNNRDLDLSGTIHRIYDNNVAQGCKLPFREGQEGNEKGGESAGEKL